MPLFFFLAGYVFQPEKYTFREFCVSRAKTILIPYGVFTLLSVLASLSRSLNGQTMTAAEII